MIELIGNEFNYRSFIKYATETCQYFSIVFERDDSDANMYLFSELYDVLENFICNKASVGCHPDTGTCFSDCDVVYFECNKFTCGVLNKADSIYDWNGGLFPEELCFYREHKKWFTLVSHEKYLFVYDETEADRLFFDSVGIKYHSSDNCFTLR